MIKEEVFYIRGHNEVSSKNETGNSMKNKPKKAIENDIGDDGAVIT